MKARITAAVVLAVALAVAASTASGSTRQSTRKAAANEVVVWVMTDAQSGWPTAVAAANNAFKAQHPGVDVNLQYQSWDTVLQKFDAALAANSAPDVIELGNSQTTAYMAAGALSAIKAANYPNSKTWLGGLKASCSYNGKLYCVPYYAGARAVIYRKDMYAAAGIKKLPHHLHPVPGRGQQADEEVRQELELLRVLRARPELVRDDDLRQGLGRRHRGQPERQVEGGLRLAEGRPGPSPPTSQWC